MKVVLRDTLTTYWRKQIQYNFGQYLEIYNTGLYEANIKFQFIQNGIQHDILGELVNNEYYKVRIPDDFLKNEDEISCFLYLESETAGETKKIIIIDVIGREWFEDEPTEEEISLIGQLIDKVNEFQAKLEDFTLTDEQIEEIVKNVSAEVKKEVNLDNYYTKEEIDKIEQNVWYPMVDEFGNITWSKSPTDETPAPVNIKGEKGDKGDDGKDGQNGLDGKNGIDGKDGQDYILTDEDKAEIESNIESNVKNYVDTYILGGEF